MSLTADPWAVDPNRPKRIEVLFDELAELTGQRNAIDGKIVDIVAEIDRDGIWGNTGCRSVPALVAWKTGCSSRNAETVVAVAARVEEFPRCAGALRAGRLSLDQVGVIAEGAADGSDEHYAQLAESATVAQLRKAISLEPKPDAKPEPEPKRSISKSSDEQGNTTYRITLPKVEAAKFDAALDSHREARIAEWIRDREQAGEVDPYAEVDTDDPRTRPESDLAAPMPTTVDAFMSLVAAGWDADVAARPHGLHTTVVVHVDVDKPATLHLGALLTEQERRLLLCDATCEVWFEERGRVIGSGRATRTVSRRLRRALEHRDRCCVVPGCGATRGLHAHHVVHWEDGGLTELWNLVLVCPYHHRMHHRGDITITGPADRLVVTDRFGIRLSNRSLARPPTTPPPAVAPYRGPTGERAQWWWYTPFEPNSPPAQN